MSTYAIGDLHGCHAEFVSLLEKLSFNAANDTLWLVGDLVNRGPSSLACLQEVQALGSAARCVLGNHDFHLLVVARGGGKLKKKRHSKRYSCSTTARTGAGLAAKPAIGSL